MADQCIDGGGPFLYSKLGDVFHVVISDDANIPTGSEPKSADEHKVTGNIRKKVNSSCTFTHWPCNQYTFRCLAVVRSYSAEFMGYRAPEALEDPVIDLIKSEIHMHYTSHQSIIWDGKSCLVDEFLIVPIFALR